jgi:hypothetical protein
MRAILPLALVTALILPAQERVAGEIIAKSPDSITLKTDLGPEVQIPLRAETTYLRVLPGVTNLSNAEKITFEDISAGDRVLVRGRTVILLSEAPKTPESEPVTARPNGIAGTVSSLNAGEREITVSADGVPVVIAGGNALYRRYTDEFARFLDTDLSSFDEIRIGDQLRAYGERAQDTAKFVASRVVFGAFRNLTGTIAAIDAALGTVTVNDLVTRQPVAIRVTERSLVRRVTPDAATVLAERMRRRTPPANSESNVLQLLSKIPAMPLAELKVGEPVIVASTKGGTALALLAGVAPVLASTSRDEGLFGGRWDLSSELAAAMVPQ